MKPISENSIVMKADALLMYKTGVCERKTFNSFIEMGFFPPLNKKAKREGGGHTFIYKK